MTYVRFVVGGDDENFHLLNGIFSVAQGLRDEGQLEEYEVAWVNDVFAWFNQNLPCPPFRENSRFDWSRNAVCWFRSDARAMLDRMWDIAALLKEKGEPVRFITSAKPGRIVYSDDHQIVAEAITRPRR